VWGQLRSVGGHTDNGNSRNPRQRECHQQVQANCGVVRAGEGDMDCSAIRMRVLDKVILLWPKLNPLGAIRTQVFGDMAAYAVFNRIPLTNLTLSRSCVLAAKEFTCQDSPWRSLGLKSQSPHFYQRIGTSPPSTDINQRMWGTLQQMASSVVRGAPWTLT